MNDAINNITNRKELLLSALERVEKGDLEFDVELPDVEDACYRCLFSLKKTIERLRARKKEEESYRRKISEETKKFRVLTETSPDCIKLFDVGGKLLYINPGGMSEHGLKQEDVEKFNALDTVVEEDRGKFAEALKEAAETGKISTIEIRHIEGKSNRETCLETVAPVKDEKGGIIGIFGVSRDITEIKKNESLLIVAKEHLDKMVEGRTKELQEKVEELTKINKVMVGRELKMAELKIDMERLKAVQNPKTDEK